MSAVPQSRPGGRTRRPPLAAIIAAVLVLAAIITLVIRSLTAAPPDPLAGVTLTNVARGDLTLGVSATGAVEPRIQADLALSAAGRVSEVLVVEGDAVAAGDPLLILDTRQLAAEVAAAEAGVAVAQADVQALRDGATPEQLAEAQAQVAAAQGGLTQTQGSVTRADINAAQADLAEARARLAEVQSGPKSDARTRAETALADASAELERQRSALAAAKERARSDIDAQGNTVRNAQANYSKAYWDYEHVKAYGTDPRSGRQLSDAEEQDVARAFEQAQRELADAEATLAQTQVAYEDAKQGEISGLEAATARVRSAQADLDALLAGSDADEVAAARAQVARAEAEIARLTGSERAGAVAAQSATLAAAQARLGQLTADPAASDLARAEARVAEAEAQLAQARVRLEDATLRAPFAGVVASVNVAPGEIADATEAPVVLIDVSSFLVKATVDEVDIARVAVGQPVEVLIDALGEPTLAGTVQRLEPLPSGESAVTSYQVTVLVKPQGRALTTGMTASATIVADQRADVLYLPTAAVRRDGATSLVSVAVTGEDGQNQIAERKVEIGLVTTESIEITSGLAEGERVVIR